MHAGSPPLLPPLLQAGRRAVSHGPAPGTPLKRGRAWDDGEDYIIPEEPWDYKSDLAVRERTWSGGPKIYMHEHIPETHHEPVYRWDGSIDLSRTHFADPYFVFGPYGGYFTHDPPFREFSFQEFEQMVGPAALRAAYESGNRVYAARGARTLDEEAEALYFKAFAGSIAGVDNEMTRAVEALLAEDSLGAYKPSLSSPQPPDHADGQPAELWPGLQLPQLGMAGFMREEVEYMFDGPSRVRYRLSAALALGSAGAMLLMTAGEARAFFESIDDAIAVQDGRGHAHGGGHAHAGVEGAQGAEGAEGAERGGAG